MARLRPIKTLSDVKDRCVILDDGTWHWVGASTRNVPCAQFKGATHNVRRIIMYLMRGTPLRRDGGDPVWVNTFDHRDVTPNRLCVGSASEMLKQMYMVRPETRLLCARGGAARFNGKKMFTPEQVRQIRCSGMSEKEGAKVFGCSPALFGMIRRGQIYAGEARNASVFSWRPAA